MGKKQVRTQMRKIQPKPAAISVRRCSWVTCENQAGVATAMRARLYASGARGSTCCAEQAISTFGSHYHGYLVGNG